MPSSSQLTCIETFLILKSTFRVTVFFVEVMIISHLFFHTIFNYNLQVEIFSTLLGELNIS